VKAEQCRVLPDDVTIVLEVLHCCCELSVSLDKQGAASGEIDELRPQRDDGDEKAVAQRNLILAIRTIHNPYDLVVIALIQRFGV
jgi:hypothetical protein